MCNGVKYVDDTTMFFFFLIYFLLGQGIYRSKYNISKGKTELYNEYSIILIKQLCWRDACDRSAINSNMQTAADQTVTPVIRR